MEGVEYFLDLLATLHSDDTLITQHGVRLKPPIGRKVKALNVYDNNNDYILLLTLSQVHAELSPLPRLPEFYLEAGAALLMAQRSFDCMTLCDEVIGLTLELLPEKLVFEEEEEEKVETGAGAVCTKQEERMKMLLWTGAAYLLQGHCHTQLKDWKQAVTHYTRYVGGNHL